MGTWVIPANVRELEDLTMFFYDNSLDFMTIGHTSNIYFKNSFNIDYIIDTRKLGNIDETDNTIVCDCGVPMKRLARYCIEHGYGGYEGFIDIPGTVGGAVVNNSGCYGSCIENVLKGIDIVMPKGVKHLNLDALKYSFRNSAIKTGLIKGVVTKAYFDKSKIESIIALQKRADNFHKHRVLTQESPSHNLGSTVNMIGDFRGVRGIIIRAVRKCLITLRLTSKINAIVPKIICLLYLRPSVAKYISCKNLNCFIWKDEGADMAFPEYIAILKKLYSNISTEIQIFE